MKVSCSLDANAFGEPLDLRYEPARQLSSLAQALTFQWIEPLCGLLARVSQREHATTTPTAVEATDVGLSGRITAEFREDGHGRSTATSDAS
jgi:hypothetical protein